MSILNYIEKIKSENEGPRITAQEPRNMDQASLVDDLEPGALKDEMKGNFDPSQETYEEYLQRINLERPFNMADGGRTPFAYAGVVKQGKRKGMHKYLNFYSKNSGKKVLTEWFKDKPEMDAALKKRKLETGRGLTEAELTKKYKKFLKEEGFKTWAEAPDDAKGRMKTALYNEQNPYESQAKWKTEGLETRVNEETRKLFEKLKPINSKTGLPMTLQEFSALTKGQKGKLLGRLKGKVKARPWAKRQGWYPEKQANKLMTYLKHAAKKQENLPLKERNFINVFEGEKFVGVKDKRKNTLWTHIDYDLSKSGAKKGTVITKHPGHKNVQFFLKQAEKFKHGTPDKLLGSYFSKYQRVPKYSEIYQFFNVDPQSAGAKKGKAYKINPLQHHHQELMAKEPARNIQLALPKQNTEASRILNQFEKGKYSFAEADKKLKEIGVRIKGSKGWMGPAKGGITAAKSIEAAQAETVKMFKEAYKKNPKIVDQMTKALNIAKKAKGPGKLKALQYLISIGGAGFVTALGFSPTEVQAAEAQAAEPGAVADYTKWMFETGLSPVDRAKIFGTAVAGDVILKKGALTKASMKGLWKTLPFIWTPMGDALIHKLLSDKEPVLEDFAEGLKAGGYDINSEEFKKAWNTIPKDERKEILYEAAGQVIDKRSTREKVSDAAADPLTHAQYAFWESGVKSMEKLLNANPFDSVLKNKLKQAALFGIRMGIPRKVIKTVSPIGWQLTGATTVGKVFKGSEPQAFYKEGENIFKGMETQVLPSMISEYEKKWVPPEKRDKSIIDYSLPESFKKIPSGITPITEYAGGGMVGIRKPHAIPPERQGLRSIMINGKKS